MAGKIWRRKIPFSYCPLPLSYVETWMPHLAPATHMVYTALARKTWGYQKDSDVIAVDQLAAMTGLSGSTVDRGLKQLRDCGLIKSEGPLRHPKTITMRLSRLLQKPGDIIDDERSNLVTLPMRSR